MRRKIFLPHCRLWRSIQANLTAIAKPGPASHSLAAHRSESLHPLGNNNMSEAKSRVVTVGEVMIELARGSDGRFSVASGGDTFNTAVYLARAGINVAYTTALGDDPYSDGIVALASAEGVATDLMLRVPGRRPGLYLIDNDAGGKRHFYYWREEAPARELFELPDWARVADSLLPARMIYFSGVTLSLYSNTGLGRFLAVVELAR